MPSTYSSSDATRNKKIPVIFPGTGRSDIKKKDATCNKSRILFFAYRQRPDKQKRHRTLPDPKKIVTLPLWCLPDT